MYKPIAGSRHIWSLISDLCTAPKEGVSVFLAALYKGRGVLGKATEAQPVELVENATTRKQTKPNAETRTQPPAIVTGRRRVRQ
jgi:hypothetical protein